MKRNKPLIVVFSVLIIVLLVSLCQTYQNYRDIQDKDAVTTDYLNYLIVLRLGRQSDIYFMCNHYLQEIETQTSQTNDLAQYLAGVKVFTQQEMIDGVYEIMLSDYEDLQELIRRICGSNNISVDKINKMTSKEIKSIEKIYIELSEYLNRNNKEESLTYYILHEDLENNNVAEQVDVLINEINALLDSLDAVFNNYK